MREPPAKSRAWVVCQAALVFAGCGPIDDPSLNGLQSNELAPLIEESAELNDLPMQDAIGGSKQLLWGDLHIHTSLSSDAYTMGVRAMPDDVYRFAKGETIQHGAGFPMTIRRPLDFVAVTDHAEYLGQARLANLDIPTTRQSLGELLRKGSRLDVTKAWAETAALISDNGFKLTLAGVDASINRQAWADSVAAAELHNNPGEFTTLIGWEWSAWKTSLTEGDDVSIHLHRNVIYADADVPEIPFSALDGSAPSDLWAFLRGERAVGRRVMAIPHNANLSAGGMYQLTSSAAQQEWDLAPEDRSSLEPISEILQVKGASETHPLLSSLDEFANFEIANVVPGREATLATARGSYARDALMRGLMRAQSTGNNPLEFGFIGSSDSHNASTSPDEDSYTGKLPMMDGSAGLRTGAAGLGLKYLTPATQWGSGGLAAVWADGNRRQDIYDALARRETYATSGPRIGLRMFGAWSLGNNESTAEVAVAATDPVGVPMGGRLPKIEVPADEPVFVIHAARDPLSANLDRIQIVKGWVDDDGAAHERVIDVAWSAGREPDPSTGRLPPVENTVNVREASYENTVGAATLTAVWRDENFDHRQHAFYYARVLEIPTPRWSTYDAKRLGIAPVEPVAIQERAIGSPIWYVPDGRSSPTADTE